MFGIPLNPPRFRAGSYAANGWMWVDPAGGFYPAMPNGFQFKASYRHEGDIEHPVQTPVMVDSKVPWVFGLADGPPAADLSTGIHQFGHWNGAGMNSITLPRHGRRPGRVAGPWPIEQPMPGAVNASFFDGHVEQVPLEQLWELRWHRDYQPPNKRPGLR
jgi:prepilin-type processing-associated H-X9-DG protein